MTTANHRRRVAGIILLLVGMASVAVWMLFWGESKQSQLSAASQVALQKPTGYPQLVSVDPLTTAEGEMCQWVPASGSVNLLEALQQEAASGASPAAAADSRSVQLDRAPVRVIRDNYPTYSAVAVDTNSNEVFLQDESLFGYKVFNRLDNTPPNANFTEPKREVGGIKTKMEYNCGLYLDPRNGDIYSIANDTTDNMVVFPHDAKGNVAPARELLVPQGTFGIAVDEENQELFLTTEYVSSVVVYRKTASGREAPLRELVGKSTQLATPHGIAVDSKNKLLYVNNSGYSISYDSAGKPIPATGKISLPSITVYPLNARGDTPPLRVIQGPKTALDWPAAMALDVERGELFVTNDGDNTVSVFRTTDSGDAAPLRVLRGPKTGLKNPTGIFLDAKSDELWVANMGNHAATVYQRTANGDVAPLRTIRSAPTGQQALIIENPGAVGYDSKREEILVPN